MRKLIIILVIFVSMMTGCRTKERVVTKNHFVNDTEINHRTEVVTLPTHYKTIVPCKEANQELQLGETKVVFKTVRDTVYLEVVQDSVVSVNEEVVKDREEVIDNNEYEKVTVTRWPKLLWISLVVNLALLAWIFRKPLLLLIKPI